MKTRSQAINNSDSDISPVKENINKARKLKVNKISSSPLPSLRQDLISCGQISEPRNAELDFPFSLQNTNSEIKICKLRDIVNVIIFIIYLLYLKT